MDFFCAGEEGNKDHILATYDDIDVASWSEVCEAENDDYFAMNHKIAELDSYSDCRVPLRSKKNSLFE